MAKFESSIEALTNVGDQVRLAYSLNNLGRAAYAMGNYSRAEEVIQAALEIRRRFHDIVGIAYSLLDMAKLYRMLGKYDKAEVYLDEGDALCRQSGLEDTLARYHNGWGMLERVRGRLKLAIDFHRSAQRIYQTETIHAHLPQTLNSLAAANMAVGAQDHAEELLLESLALARSLGNIFDQAMALALLGETKLAQAQPDEAGELLSQALCLADRSGAAPLALQILYVVAQGLVRRQADQPQKANALLRYVVSHTATEADIRSRAEECLLEFDTPDDIEDLSDHDIWRVVADLKSGSLLQATAKS